LERVEDFNFFTTLGFIPFLLLLGITPKLKQFRKIILSPFFNPDFISSRN